MPIKSKMTPVLILSNLNLSFGEKKYVIYSLGCRLDIHTCSTRVGEKVRITRKLSWLMSVCWPKLITQIEQKLITSIPISFWPNNEDQGLSHNSKLKFWTQNPIGSFIVDFCRSQWVPAPDITWTPPECQNNFTSPKKTSKFRMVSWQLIMIMRYLSSSTCIAIKSDQIMFTGSNMSQKLTCQFFNDRPKKAYTELSWTIFNI